MIEADTLEENVDAIYTLKIKISQPIPADGCIEIKYPA